MNTWAGGVAAWEGENVRIAELAQPLRQLLAARDGEPRCAYRVYDAYHQPAGHGNMRRQPGRALGLNTMRYGPYFVVANASEDKQYRYEIPEDMRGKAATDLLTGEQAPLKSSGIIPPSSSRVFVLSNKSK